MKALLIVLSVIAAAHVVGSFVAYATTTRLAVLVGEVTVIQWLPQTAYGFYLNTAAVVLAVVALVLGYVGFRKMGL